MERRIDEISGVTLQEWLEIRATLTSRDDDRYNCQKCLNKYEGRTDGEQMLEKVRANMGCREVKPQPIHKIGEEVRLRSCIGNYVKPQVFALLSAQRKFSQGVMPYSGGLMDQPAKIVDVFSVIESHQAENAERERQKTELASRRSGGLRRGG